MLFYSLQEVVSLNSNLNEGEAITGLTKSKHIKEKNVRNSSHFLLQAKSWPLLLPLTSLLPAKI